MITHPTQQIRRLFDFETGHMLVCEVQQTVSGYPTSLRVLHRKRVPGEVRRMRDSLLRSETLKRLARPTSPDA